jgi:hypothetical protein
MLKIKATGHYTEKDNHTVVFEENNNKIAIFNMAEIVGFVESGHIVN